MRGIIVSAVVSTTVPFELLPQAPFAQSIGSAMSQPELRIDTEHWPYKRPFAISRAVLEVQTVLRASATWGDLQAQGEGEQHESDLSATAQAMQRGLAQLPWLVAHLDRHQLRAHWPADGLRNAVDAMLWDLECKRTGVRSWELAGMEAIDEKQALPTMYTVTLESAEAMSNAASAISEGVIIKVKLGDRSAGGIDRDIERLHAVAAAAPQAILTVDPNEGWTPAGLVRFSEATTRLRLALIEQPLPAGQEDLLPGLGLRVPIAADEACTTLDTLPRLAGRVQVVNLKLDKCGGLTEALLMCDEAERLGLRLMIGCNCGTSLAMAPAFLVATRCEFVDLDGPFHLREDRRPSMTYERSFLHAPPAGLWG
jgi:L-alanine-DL-glutamate epimerase-like enolase superfamily enzyme